MSDLFAHDEPLAVAPDAYLLKGFLSDEDEMLLAEIRRLTAISPFRHMQTPGGYRMSAAMSKLRHIRLGLRCQRLPLLPD